MTSPGLDIVPGTAYFLVGPTATGKTDVAQSIAERCECEIISADSMLVYRGMDVGTAKPAPAERGQVRYHGIDLVTPDRTFSVGDFRDHALNALAEIADRGRPAIIAGGTGLYVKALTHGLADIPVPDQAARERAGTILRERGVDGLREVLRETRPDLYASLDDTSNPRRLLRALEWSLAAIEGAPCNWHADPQGAALAGLAVEPDCLKSRIESRAARMYDAGLVAEVSALLERYPHGLSRTARQAIGYAEAIDLLAGRCSREEAVTKTAARTRRLAKRQRTWFRHQADVAWVQAGADEDAGVVADRVIDCWRRHGPTEIRD